MNDRKCKDCDFEPDFSLQRAELLSLIFGIGVVVFIGLLAVVGS